MRVLMIGAGRDVRGGVSTVVNGYYQEGLHNLVDLVYLPTMQDGPKIKKLFIAALARLKFEGLIKKADILHVHMSADASFYRKAIFIKRAARVNKKIIIHMHGSTFDSFYKERLSPEGQKKVRDVFALADQVIALSQYWRDFLAENICAENKIKILYNSIPLPGILKEDYSDDNLLFLGIIGKRKGVYDLIEAMKTVAEAYPSAHLYIGGDGEEKEAREAVKVAGLNDNITFTGWLRGDAKEEAFLKSGIYVLPSYNEGMPMSVLEAMGRGLCTIASNVGGIPHIIENNKNGIMITPGDIPALSGAIISLMGQKDIKEKLGREGRRTIEEHFDLKNSVKELMKIYKELSE